MLSFADIVEQGNELRKHRDNIDWGLGDLGVIFLDTPEAQEDGATISDLAAAWNVTRSSLSAFISNARFYPVDCRTFDTLSYTHYDYARRNCGGDLDRAVELLIVAVKNAYSVRQFERYLKDIYWEGEIDLSSPDPLAAAKACVPDGEYVVWVMVKKKSAEDKA